MKVIGRYSFNGANEWFAANAPGHLTEMEAIISAIDAAGAMTKVCEEAGARNGMLLFDPAAMNVLFENESVKRGWRKRSKRHSIAYADHYVEGYDPELKRKGVQGWLEMDFWKEPVGIEVQFGKYSFMAYDMLAKMAIMKKRGIIAAGIEIVPSKKMLRRMSSGIGTFEQIAGFLDEIGPSDRDIPVLVLGIEPEIVPAFPNHPEAVVGQ